MCVAFYSKLNFIGAQCALTFPRCLDYVFPAKQERLSKVQLLAIVWVCVCRCVCVCMSICVGAQRAVVSSSCHCHCPYQRRQQKSFCKTSYKCQDMRTYIVAWSLFLSLFYSLSLSHALPLLAQLQVEVVCNLCRHYDEFCFCPTKAKLVNTFIIVKSCWEPELLSSFFRLPVELSLQPCLLFALYFSTVDPKKEFRVCVCVLSLRLCAGLMWTFK